MKHAFWVMFFCLFYLPVFAAISIPQEEVSITNDDAMDNQDSCVNNGEFLSAGVFWQMGWASQFAGLRFQTVPIPQGASITSATLTMYIQGVAGTVTPEVYGELSSNCSGFCIGGVTCTGDGRCISDRAKTAQSTSLASPSAGQRQVDVALQISEIVGQAGWVKDNSLCLILTRGGTPDGTNYVSLRSIDTLGGLSFRAKLDVSYTQKNGDACTDGGQCTSGNCIDDVCCQTTCDGNCNRCNASGSPGVCTDVDADCTGNCDFCSAGNCTADESLCPECSDCAGGGTSFSCMAMTNDGDGTCTGVCTSCVAGTCANRSVDDDVEIGSSCKYCSSGIMQNYNLAYDAATNYTCGGGNYCSNGTCTAKLANGQTCSSNIECANGNCMDGFCCNTPCGGNCDRCNVAELEGVCTNVDADCTGSCDVCNAGNCAADVSLCPGCYGCAGGGTSYNCVFTGDSSRCGDGVACTVESCQAGVGCVSTPDDAACLDTSFCNGQESCDAQQGCLNGVSPCAASGEACDEANDRCVACASNQECDDNVACTTDTCDLGSGKCVFTPDNGQCPDDGLYCNGSESCSAQQGCVQSGDPCTGQGLKCSEALDQCVTCLVVQDCDDGLFCNGVEQCDSAGNCVTSVNPCDDQDACTLDSCDEGADACSHVPDPQCSQGKPVIACQPNLNATIGMGYLYDEDGRIEAAGPQPIAWTKASGPTQFHVDPATGTITWIPASGGQVQLQVQASNDKGSDNCAWTVQVASGVSGVPQAVMAINPQMGRVPLQVHLDGSSSVAPAGGSILSYRWDFGDGSEWGYGATQDHSFLIAGSYQVGLLVTEAGGSSSQAKGLVRVLSQDGKMPPVAKIVASATEGQGNLSVDFSCACEAGDAPIVGYLWDFADQSQSDQIQVQHNFLVGRYEVKLTVLDENGLSGTDRLEIEVRSAGGQKLPPVCRASGAPLSGAAPLGVSYNGSYADPDGLVTEWKWQFGKEEAIGQDIVNRIYADPGIYDAVFVVTDNDSLTCQSSVEVVVGQAPEKTPPKILSLPVKTATCHEPYLYDQDGKPSARGDRPIYWKLGKEVGGQILGKPEGMEINAQTGEVSWTPSDKQTGVNNVTLIVSNDQGADVQEIEIEVACTQAPSEGCGCENQDSGMSGFWLLGFVMFFRRRAKGGRCEPAPCRLD